MIICLCKGVTQDDLIEALSTADESVELHDIVWLTDCTTDCGSCKEYISYMIDKWLNEKKKKKRKSKNRGR